MNAFIILPDQLFYNTQTLKILSLHDVIYIIEDPHYFTGYTYHRSKIILHRSSMQKYFNYLKKYFSQNNKLIETTSDLNNAVLNKQTKIYYISYFNLRGEWGDENAEKSAEKTAEKNVEKTPEKTAEKSVEKSAEKTTEKTIEKKSADKSTDKNAITAPVNSTKKYTSWIDWAADNIENHRLNLFEPSNYLLYDTDLKNKRFHGIPAKLYPSPAFYLSIDDIRNNYTIDKSYRQTNFYQNMCKKYANWFVQGEDMGAAAGLEITDTAVTAKKYLEEIGDISEIKPNIFDDENSADKSADKSAEKTSADNLLSNDETAENKQLYNNAIRYSGRFNTIGGIQRYPISRAESLYYLKHFCVTKIAKFGEYEDISLDNNNIIYHSCLSSSINIGLLTPAEVVNYVSNYYLENKKQIPKTSFESFLRQILGWREFVHLNYILNGHKIQASNYFKLTRTITEDFYKGTTGYPPIDIIIKDVIRTGYTHHINRLMYLGGFFLLQQIRPKDVFSWFMELFIDAYEWVMIPNIEMSQYNAGGFIGSRPYFSSSNYLRKMGNYQIGPWVEKWDSIYYKFIHDKKDKLVNQYFVSNWVRNWKEKTKSERKKILAVAAESLI